MPYADHQGTRIHYEVEGDGPPLVLQHGFTGNLKRWYSFGYVAALKSNYRLILVDARGHGGATSLMTRLHMPCPCVWAT